MSPHQSNSLSYALGSFRYTHAPYDRRHTLDQARPLPPFNLTYDAHSVPILNDASRGGWPIPALQSGSARSTGVITSTHRLSTPSQSETPLKRQGATAGSGHINHYSECSTPWSTNEAKSPCAPEDASDTWIAGASTSSGSNTIQCCSPAAHWVEADLGHPSESCLLAKVIALSQSPGVSDKGKSNKSQIISRIDGPQARTAHPQANASKSSYIPEPDRRYFGFFDFLWWKLNWQLLSGSYSPDWAAPEHYASVGPLRRIMPKLKKDGTYEIRFTKNLSGRMVKNTHKRCHRGELGELEHEERKKKKRKARGRVKSVESSK